MFIECLKKTHCLQVHVNLYALPTNSPCHPICTNHHPPTQTPRLYAWVIFQEALPDFFSLNLSQNMKKYSTVWYIK